MYLVKATKVYLLTIPSYFFKIMNVSGVIVVYKTVRNPIILSVYTLKIMNPEAFTIAKLA